MNIEELTATQTAIKAVTDFQLTEFHVDATAGVLVGTIVVNGASLATAQQAKSQTTDGQLTTSNVGLTLYDFEEFRKAVNAAQLEIQAKIDELLSVDTVNCNSSGGFSVPLFNGQLPLIG